MDTSKQVKPPPNPDGKGGFGDHPENRSNGHWKKDMVFSFQYRRFMNMTVAELKAYAEQPDTNRTVVEDLALARVLEARQSLPDVKEITDRTEGKAPQFIDVTSGGQVVDTGHQYLKEIAEALNAANPNAKPHDPHAAGTPASQEPL